jgi:EmrB/QacA subfamily drug resistance transporter
MDNQSVPQTENQSGWLILITLALAQFMLVVDVTIVNIALPSIQRTFNMTNSNLQWIVTAYALTFGGCLLLGGRFADLFGRRRLFLIGLVAFTLASLGSGLARTGNLLIIFRAAQGLAGAFMSPAALSMVLVTYREGQRRNVALSVWSAVAAAGGALGILLGGIFTQYLGWRWNFFINVPIGVIVFLATMALIPKHESESTDKNVDIIGAALVTGGLMTLVYGLVKAPTYGWTDHRSLNYFGIAFVSLLAFVINETQVKNPLIPLRIFRTRNLASADVIIMLMGAALFSSFFIGTLYVQNVLGFSPIKTGVSFLIFPACVAIVATSVPRLIKRIGFRPILIGAPLCMAAGLFFESGIPLNGSYWANVAPGFILMALGMGAAFVSSTIAATSGVAPTESGLASGLWTTSQQIGGAIGLASITAIVTSSSTAFFKTIYVPGASVKTLTAEATVHGFQSGFLLAGYFALAASIVAILFIRAPKPVPEPQPLPMSGAPDVAA